MYWYKVKNVLIILFALINLFLIGTIAVNNIEKKREADKLNASLISILEKNGVKLGDGVILPDTKKLDVKQVENRVVDSTAFAKSILGEGAVSAYNADGVPYYRADGKELYVNEGRFHYYNTLLRGTENTGADSVKPAAEKLRQMGIDMSPYKGALYGDTLIFTVYIDASPLFLGDIYVKMSGEEISEAWGHILWETAYSGTPSSVRSATDVLLEFLQDPARGGSDAVISECVLGYSILTQASSVEFKTADAVPTYMIKTADGRSFYYDARQN